jgi:hypothetical protein
MAANEPWGNAGGNFLAVGGSSTPRRGTPAIQQVAMSATATPTSIRLPANIDDEIRTRARQERRSFTQQMLVVLEAGLGLRVHPDDDVVDQDEVERLADLARETLAVSYGPNEPWTGPVPYPFPPPPGGGG